MQMAIRYIFILILFPFFVSSTTVINVASAANTIENTDVAVTTTEKQNFQPVDAENKVHLVIPLPEFDDFSNGRNPFLLSLQKVKPLVDLALERVYGSQLLPNGSLNLIYLNSNLSDAVGPNVAVQQLLKNEIDCIIGYAYGYALAPVARMSPYWRNGIPVITPIGLTMSLDDKSEYQLMTRINSPYKVVSSAVQSFFAQREWKRHIFMFHHAKSPTVAVGECFLLMASIQHPLRERFEMQHNFYTFNEDTHGKMTEEQRKIIFKNFLMQSSEVANAYEAAMLIRWLTLLLYLIGRFSVPVISQISKTPTTSGGLATTATTTAVTNPPRSRKDVLAHFPFNVIVILPEKESIYDNFGMTLQKAKPVIDIAVQDVINAGRMPPNWVNLTYWDSRLYEDILLAERHATVGVIQAYCEHRLDAILGFADNYGLATVTKVTAGLNDGVPILTTSGMPSLLNSKKEYPYLTRMQGSYRLLADSMYQLIAYHDQDSNSNSSLNYLNLIFFYHDKRRAVNRKVNTEEAQETGSTSSHCYFSLYAIKRYFTEKSKTFKDEWALNTPQFPFDEDLEIGREKFKEWLRDISYQSNGTRFFSSSFF